MVYSNTIDYDNKVYKWNRNIPYCLSLALEDHLKKKKNNKEKNINEQHTSQWTIRTFNITWFFIKHLHIRNKWLHLCALVQNRGLKLFHSFFKILHIKLKEMLRQTPPPFLLSSKLSSFLKRFVGNWHWLCPVGVPKSSSILYVVSLHVEMWVRRVVVKDSACHFSLDRNTQGHRNAQAIF